MSQTIEGLFLKSTITKNNSVLIDVLTENYGRCNFVISNTNRKKSNFLLQPFHFLEFSSKFNSEKKINTATNIDLVFSVVNILSDIRKTGYAILITEILTKVIQPQEKNTTLYSSIKDMVISFESNPFSPVFGLFFIKNLLDCLGIKPINNYSLENQYFNPRDGKFCSIKSNDIKEDFPNRDFSKLLGTKIDYDPYFLISNTNRRKIMTLLLYFMNYHGLINTTKIKSIQILQSLYD